MSQVSIERVTEIKRRHEKELMRKPNVVAVGVGFKMRGGTRTDEACIVVSVKTKLPAAQLKGHERIPSSLDGVPVDVVETGEIRALGGR